MNLHYKICQPDKVNLNAFNKNIFFQLASQYEKLFYVYLQIRKCGAIVYPENIYIYGKKLPFIYDIKHNLFGRTIHCIEQQIYKQYSNEMIEDDTDVKTWMLNAQLDVSYVNYL